MPNPFSDILGGIGYALNLPGALTRGVLAGQPGQQMTADELLQSWGLAENDPDRWEPRDFASMAAGPGLDMLLWSLLGAGIGAGGRALLGRSGAKAAQAATTTARATPALSTGFPGMPGEILRGAGAAAKMPAPSVPGFPGMPGSILGQGATQVGRGAIRSRSFVPTLPRAIVSSRRLTPPGVLPTGAAGELPVAARAIARGKARAKAAMAAERAAVPALPAIPTEVVAAGQTAGRRSVRAMAQMTKTGKSTTQAAKHLDTVYNSAIHLDYSQFDDIIRQTGRVFNQAEVKAITTQFNKLQGWKSAATASKKQNLENILRTMTEKLESFQRTQF